MKFNTLAVSGLALSAFLVCVPALAQDRVDANGMPTTHSTPAEQAATAELNKQDGVTTTPAPSTAANDAHHGSATSHSSYPHVLEAA